MTTDSMFRPLTADEFRTAHTGYVQEAWRPIVPVPADAPLLTESDIMCWAKPGYGLTQVSRYKDASGELLGYFVRFDNPDAPGDKDIVPLTFCQGPDGARQWRKKNWETPRPLYGLDRLAGNSDAPVLVVEGEKTADAAQELFPDHVVVTSPGGSNAAGKADWSPVKGRDVTIWPDNDDPGRKYADDVTRLASEAGAPSVAIVQVPTEFPSRWDLADPPPVNCLHDHLLHMVANAKPATAPEAVWPAPDARYLRTELPEPPVLPLAHVFSQKLADWMRDAAEAKAAPVDYVMAAILTVCGSLIGNTRWIAPWSGWTEPPIIWAVVIGNPSASKSPGLDAVLSPLRKAERDLREKAKATVDEYRAKAEVAKIYEATWKEAMKAAIKNGEPEPERPDSVDPGPEPIMPRLAVSDTTIEKLALIMSGQPRGTLLARDELAGWLLGMSRYSNNNSDRPFWLEAYGGRHYTVERMGRDAVYIEHLSVGVIGSIQPDRLRGLLLKADDDGLLARFLPIWPSPAPVKRPSQSYNEAFMENIISRLLTLDMSMDENGQKRPSFIAFDDDARNLLDDFRETVRTWEAEAEGLLLSFIGKLPGVAIRLSLVLAYLEWASGEAESEPREIGVTYFGKAAHLVEAYLLPMARRAYAEASVSKREQAARRLLKLIRKEGWHEFSSREVLRSGHTGLAASEEVDMALKMLEEADVIRPVEVAAGTGAGRHTRRFIVNPLIHGDQQ